MDKDYFKSLREYYINYLMEEYKTEEDRFVSFSLTEDTYKKFFQYINIICDKGFNSINDCFSKDFNAQFKISLLNKELFVVFEKKTNDKNTLASFNPLIYPYEICLNVSDMTEIKKEILLRLINSNKVKISTAHEICHFIQTLIYGEEMMKKSVKISQSNYNDSIVELEACVFMVLEDAQINNNKINNIEQFFKYVLNISEDFLQTAKNIIISNKDKVTKMLEYNTAFLTESNKFLEAEDKEIDFTATPVGLREHVMCWPPKF